MAKHFWAFLIVGGIALALFNGNMQDVADAVLSSGQTAVETVLAMVGGLAIWMGILNIAKKAGIIEGLSKLLRRPLGWLFPEAKDDIPALGAISANIAANIMGMGNAATPAGLEAMQELQRLNPNKKVATNAMCMLLIVNASSVQLFPTTIVTLRQAAGSSTPADIAIPALIVTALTTVFAIAAAKILEKRHG